MKTEDGEDAIADESNSGIQVAGDSERE